MTTLTKLKAIIAADLGRSDLTTLIADTITQTFEEIQHRKFWFNQTRDWGFNTVADDYDYGSGTTDTVGAQTVDITDFWDIKAVYLDISNRRRWLNPTPMQQMEMRFDNAASTGEPYDWAWFNETLFLYPIPSTVYPVRVVGHFNIAMPATDDEADNAWMLHAYQYLREATKANIYQSRVNNPDRLRMALLGQSKQMDLLIKKTSRKTQSQRIKGSEMRVR